jgi:adenylate cyclase
MDSHLIIMGEDNRRVSLAEKQSWMIGRGRGNDINIDHASISRRHAMLQVTESGEVYLVDCGSRNGSFLNGYRVAVRVKLSDGDQLSFGEARAQFGCAMENAMIAHELRTIAGTMPVQHRRMLTVLVVDIRDFTVLSRELGEQKLAELMGRFFRNAGEIIREQSTRMHKYIGDAVMAVWFHETTTGADPAILQPFEALRAIHHTVTELNQEFTLPFPLRIGAGVNTGFAMVGNTGSAGSADYTALGDTVNAAFRLESATKVICCDVAIGDMTYKRLREATGEAGPFIASEVFLKGFGQRIAHSCSFSALEAFLVSRSGVRIPTPHKQVSLE